MGKFIYLMLVFAIANIPLSGQSGAEITGRVVDSINRDGIPFANVVGYKDDIRVMGTATDYEGYFKFPGIFDFTKIKTSYLGNEVEVTIPKNAEKGVIDLGEIKIAISNQIMTPGCALHPPSVDMWEMERKSVIRREQIEHSPFR